MAMSHRGPDARGVTSFGSVVLGHARLAILDLDQRSNQPFEYASGALTYNGELWNYRGLRSELEVLGHSFRTSGDTEVLAAALCEWGEDALLRLNGMFAFAWFDGSSVLLSRDRFGEVPLHVGWRADGAFCFASELRGLAALGAEGGLMVPPGERMIWRDGQLDISRWHVQGCTPTEHLDPAGALHREVWLSVRERAISDVPVCVMLSGGIDSGVIASCLSREVRGLVAFTAYNDARSSDLRGARSVAEHLGIELREVFVPVPSSTDLDQAAQVIESRASRVQVELAWHCMQLAEAIREGGFKVAFSGEGSDELFASYGMSHFGIVKHGWHEYRRNLFLAQAFKNFPRCNKVFLWSGVEVRLPFLHPALVDLILSMSMDEVEHDARRKSGRRQKAVLRHAFASELPERVVWSPKVPFQVGTGIRAMIEGGVS